MLQTSTGVQMCDSGGEDGRARQRNQKKTLEDFEKEDAVSLDIHTRTNREGEATTSLDYTISVRHYLTGQLELDDLCDEFNAQDCPDWSNIALDTTVYGISEAQGLRLQAEGFRARGQAFNTYNGETALSQILQGIYLEGPNGDDYVLLQIHQGADVRGGYTDAKLFKTTCDGYLQPETVYGTLDGRPVSNIYDGVTLRRDDDSADDYEEEATAGPDSTGTLYLAEY